MELHVTSAQAQPVAITAGGANGAGNSEKLSSPLATPNSDGSNAFATPRNIPEEGNGA